MCVASHAQSTQYNKFGIPLQCLKEFSILWFLMGMVKHSKRYQNSKFVISLQYLKNEVRDEVDFFHADKY